MVVWAQIAGGKLTSIVHLVLGVSICTISGHEISFFCSIYVGSILISTFWIFEFLSKIKLHRLWWKYLQISDLSKFYSMLDDPLGVN